MEERPVLIAGGGPVGLCLGIALARAGHRALLVEERPGTTAHPKATLVGARTMEHFRAWDRLDARVMDAAIRQEDDYFILFCDRLAGHELHGVAPNQLAESLGVSAGTITRDLHNLRAAGAAEQIQETGRYRLAPKMVQIAVAHMTAMDRAERQLGEIKQRFTREP